MPRTSPVLRLPAALLCLAVAPTAMAAEFCVTNSVQLWAALNTAASNGEDDIIRIAAGTYNAGGVFGFNYNALADGGDDKHLTLIGGFTEFFDNPCGQHLVDDPLLTVLDAGGVRRVLRIALRDNSNLTVRLLTFMDGYAADDQRGGGLLIERLNTATGSVDIERNAFIGNEAQTGGALFSSSGGGNGGGGRLRVTNNLFLDNHARGATGAAGLYRGNGSGIFFTNNTVLANTREGGSAGGVFIQGPVTRFVANNNFWDNEGFDLIVTDGSDGHFTLRNNNISTRSGIEPDLEIANISVAPEYEPGSFDFTPRRSSPLVDAGTHPPFLFPQWYLAETDLRNQPRIVGPAVDIGAYENERIFGNGFNPLM